MAPEVKAALLALFAAFIGGAIQHVASRHADRERSYAQLRTEAYQLFIQAISGFGVGGARSDLPFDPAVMLLESKAKLALYGSPTVLNKVGIFFSEHAALTTDAGCEAFIDIAEAMRADSLGRNYAGFRVDFDNTLLRGSK